MEFKPFPKINRLDSIEMTITQKIHGSNASICIYEEDGIINIKCGSRNRWISIEDDNFGFANFVESHKEEFIRLLGPGHHFGEWAGPGINSGEGLKNKTFVLFEHWKYPPERQLPTDTVAVPVLYRGAFSASKIEEVMNDLKTNGSKLSPGFMRPEGVVVDVLGHKLKKVFEAEETQWKNNKTKLGQGLLKGLKEELAHLAHTKYAHLFQPIRMEKLLSKDERLLREYPASLPAICAEYVNDLIREDQITGDKDEIKAAKKAIGSELFKFAKECVMKQKGIGND